MAAKTFTITRDGPPQTKGTSWFAEVDGANAPKFLVGQSVPFKDGDGAHRGLYQTEVLKQIPALYYDRAAASKTIGLWAHFIWPTVVAESSGGHHLLVNTYDRARFTFGFYQLAAHTPDDNLILLFRTLVALPKARDYFPDLILKNGKVHRTEDGKTHSLEVVTNVHRPNGKYEDQIVGFMSYLNPDTTNVGETEVANTAKLMHWLQNDPAAVDASVSVAMSIMRRKVRAQSSAFKLKGKDPRLAIWVSDIRHQGRGSPDQIKVALASTTVAKQLDALYEIGRNNRDYDGRRQTVRRCIATLTDEGVFANVSLGDQALPLAG